MSILCAIPARYASTRLPGKPLLAVKGLPLVMWAYNRAVESRAFDAVCVATDDSRIYDAVTRHGGKALMTSAEHQSGTDRINEAAESFACDYVVNLQGDEPEVPAEILRQFAAELPRIDNNSLLTSLTNATISEASDPNVVKAVIDAQGHALYFSRSLIPYDRGGTTGMIYKHTGMYGFTRASLKKFCSLPRGTLEVRESLEQLRALENGMRIICIVKEYSAAGIDTPEDLEHFRRRAV
jgi:3-deoxy-manno-octulosonate cytidylyltransferase (CMP-KDO synthetase)